MQHLHLPMLDVLVSHLSSSVSCISPFTTKYSTWSGCIFSTLNSHLHIFFHRSFKFLLALCFHLTLLLRQERLELAVWCISSDTNRWWQKQNSVVVEGDVVGYDVDHWSNGYILQRGAAARLTGSSSRTWGYKVRWKSGKSAQVLPELWYFLPF